MQIEEAIVHGFEKAAQSYDVEVNPREELSPIDGMMTHLAEEVLKVYGRRSDSNGTFDPDSTAYPFSGLLEAYSNGEGDLVQFSRSACSLIAAQMRTSHLATGGYAFFIRYTNMGHDWILVLMLKLKPGTSINSDTLELLPSLSFDINHLHEAARINISKWTSGEQPYLSFIKKKNAGDDITRYFRLALGCTEYTDSKFNTEQIVEALNNYCTENNMTPRERQTARKRLFDYFEEKQNSEDKSVNLVTLSAMINDINPENFHNYIRDNDVPVSDVFTPSKTVYGKLSRIKRRFGGVALSFDVEDVLNDNVDYDPDSEVLYIRNVPEPLINDIRRAKGDE